MNKEMLEKTAKVRMSKRYLEICIKHDLDEQIYTDDLASMFGINSRNLKEAIERKLPYIRKEFGEVEVFRHIRTFRTNNFNGYSMPLPAVAYVLIEALGEDLYNHCDKELLRQLM